MFFLNDFPFSIFQCELTSVFMEIPIMIDLNEPISFHQCECQIPIFDFFQEFHFVSVSIAKMELLELHWCGMKIELLNPVQIDESDVVISVEQLNWLRWFVKCEWRMNECVAESFNICCISQSHVMFRGAKFVFSKTQNMFMQGETKRAHTNNRPLLAVNIFSFEKRGAKENGSSFVYTF